MKPKFKFLDIVKIIGIEFYDGVTGQIVSYDSEDLSYQVRLETNIVKTFSEINLKLVARKK